jgi:hypothetical protein
VRHSQPVELSHNDWLHWTSEVKFAEETVIFLPTTTSKPALWSNQSPVQPITKALSPGIKQPKRVDAFIAWYLDKDVILSLLL